MAASRIRWTLVIAAVACFHGNCASTQELTEPASSIRFQQDLEPTFNDDDDDDNDDAIDQIGTVSYIDEPETELPSSINRLPSSSSLPPVSMSALWHLSQRLKQNARKGNNQSKLTLLQQYFTSGSDLPGYPAKRSDFNYKARLGKLKPHMLSKLIQRFRPLLEKSHRNHNNVYKYESSRPEVSIGLDMAALSHFYHELQRRDFNENKIRSTKKKLESLGRR